MNKKTVKVSAKTKEGFKIVADAGKHQLIIDQPEYNGGTDSGASPLEYMLSAVAGCMMQMAVMMGKMQRIKISSFSVDIEGTVDIDGIMGKDPSKRSGFEEIIVKANLDADISNEEKLKFLEMVEKSCPVAETILNGTTIKLELAQ